MDAGGLPELVDWIHFERSRAEMGPSFIKIIGYFREDGIASLQKIEAAMRAEDMVAMVAPAHKLKGEARQVGAYPLADRAEHIETTARRCIETKRLGDELIPDVVALRKLWQETLAAIDQRVNPLMQRSAPGGFGRRGAMPHNQGFGRL